MEKINELLEALNNKVPQAIANRIEGLKSLNVKLVGAKKEHDDKPTEDTQIQLNEIQDFISDSTEGLIEDLTTLVEKQAKDQKAKQEKLEADAKKKAEEEANAQAEADAKKKAEEEANAQAEAEAKKKAEEEANATAEAEAKRKEEEEANAQAEAEAEAEANAQAQAEAKAKKEKEKDSSNVGILGFVIGVGLLIASVGAINILKKR